MNVTILGTTYTINYKAYDDDNVFRNSGVFGYCKYCGAKEIVICSLATNPDYDNYSDAERAAAEKLTLRHEIVHAFMVESGLPGTASASYMAWSENEEMVEWIAYMGEKIYQAWVDADAL